MQVVIDTNVLVSGLLNPSGFPGEMVDMIFSRQIEPAYDDRILHEYSVVLRRTTFSFPHEAVDDLLDAVRVLGVRVVPAHFAMKLPDDGDRMFVECGLSIGSKVVVTGNKRHFPVSVVHGLLIVSPKEFFEKHLRRQ